MKSGLTGTIESSEEYLSLEERDAAGPSTRAPKQALGICYKDTPFSTILGTPTSDPMETGEDMLCALLDEGFSFKESGRGLMISHKELPRTVYPFCAEAIELIRGKVEKRLEQKEAVAAMKEKDKALDATFRGPSFEERIAAARNRNGMAATGAKFAVKRKGRHGMRLIPVNQAAREFREGTEGAVVINATTIIVPAAEESQAVPVMVEAQASVEISAEASESSM